MNTFFFLNAMKHFNYLVTDYGFEVKWVEESEHHPQIEGRIEFENNSSFVTVTGEQFGADACVGRIMDDKHTYNLDPRTIHEYLSLTESEKQLIYSHNIEDDRKARLIIHQARLNHTKIKTDKIVDEIDSQLSDYSKWIRLYAEPFLRGDFSKWLEIYEYKINRNRAAYARSGKKEIIQINNRGTYYMRSVFKDSLEYLERLRDEYKKA